MKKLFTLVITLTAAFAVHGQPLIMGHRGFTTTEGSYQNTLTSLRKAQELGIYSIELDVHLSTDDSLMIIHGPTIPGTGKDIQKVDYATARSFTLPNGDFIPTLPEFFAQAKKTPELFLFLELKKQENQARETRMAEKVISLCDRMGMYPQMWFISFEQHLIDEILRLHPDARTMYITGDAHALSPRAAAEKGYKGISYHWDAVLNEPEILDECRAYGLETVIWPVNSTDLALYAVRHDLTHITTDYPQKVKALYDAMAGFSKGWRHEPLKGTYYDCATRINPSDVEAYGYEIRASKKLICFDLDGTLTQHKTPISPENRAVLDKLAERYMLVMAGGGGCERIYKQMGNYPIDILGNYGMQESTVKDGNFVMVRDLKEEVDRKFFEERCNYLRKKYGYTRYKGESLEFHESGMVTFGLLGTKAAAKDKLLFDPDKAKRRAMLREVQEIFKDYSVFIGGTTSFDIAKKKYNKYDSLMEYARQRGISKDEILFVGDDFGDGGNDSQARLYGLDYIQIDDYTSLPDRLEFLYR